MQQTSWILIDTESTGLRAPIFVVELAAQRMRGWEADGAAFRRLLHQKVDIPEAASRLHGYTPEILARDGDDAWRVYEDFADYTQGLPLVAYNLRQHWDAVLLPEWARLGVAPIGVRGFCAYHLAQRLLDPLPTGKLSTLRQLYQLPEREAPTALGKVETVIDLMAQVLRPLAEQRGLCSWEAIQQYTEADWYPSRIAFGKYKGRDFRDARTDNALLAWLQWLAQANHANSAAMGQWYLAHLQQSEAADADTFATADAAVAVGIGLVSYRDAEWERRKQLIAAARERLAELESDYARERHAVEVTQAQLFSLLRERYQARDRLRLIIEYRQLFLDTLLRKGEEEAAQVSEDFANAKQQNDADYEEAGQQAAKKHDLSDAQQQEIKALWKKLVRVYHPDRFAQHPEKQQAYDRLTQIINQAKDQGDMERLREIADDPQGFMQRQGLGMLDFSDERDIAQLDKLYQSLQSEIARLLEALEALRIDPAYELHRLTTQDPHYLQTVANKHARLLDLELAQLTQHAEALAAEIKDLTGNDDHNF